MKKTKKLLLLFLFAFALNSFAQKDGFLWSVDNATVFDNREGDNTYSPNGTIFFDRLSLEIGIRFLKNHELKGGVSYIQPIGIGFKKNKFVPILYYTFTQPEKKIWNVSVGMIPRSKLHTPAPKILWSDSMTYYNPTIRGVLLQCVKDSFYAEMMLDWRSLQSETQREAFNVNFCAEGRLGRYFLIGGRAQLNHLAKQEPAPKGQGVNDDMAVNPYVGFDFKSATPLDSFRIEIGEATMADRCRALGDWEVRSGLLVDVLAQYKKIGIRETFYAGQGQQPLYYMYGSLLNMGEPHYQSRLYSYTSIFSPIVQNAFVNFIAALDFNVTAEGVSCYQKILLRVNIDSDKWKARNEAKGRIANVY